MNSPRALQVYAPSDKGEARDYGVARYGMEVQRLLSVLDEHLEGREYMVGDAYTVADMACFPWVQTLRGKGYDRPGQPRTFDFLGVSKYTNVMRWADMIMERPATYRGALELMLTSAYRWLSGGCAAVLGWQKLCVLVCFYPESSLLDCDGGHSPRDVYAEHLCICYGDVSCQCEQACVSVRGHRNRGVTTRGYPHRSYDMRLEPEAPQILHAEERQEEAEEEQGGALDPERWHWPLPAAVLPAAAAAAAGAASSDAFSC